VERRRPLRSRARRSLWAQRLRLLCKGRARRSRLPDALAARVPLADGRAGRAAGRCV